MLEKGAARCRILVIDDQEATRYVLRRILQRAGYEVMEARTGEEGLAQSLLAPDMVIADVNLPDMLGYDLTRRLKSNAATASLPVLQISAAFVSDESKVQALEGGADSYLVQPVEPAVLLAQVQALLRLRKAEALSNLSARQWETTFDALSDGLALADADGTILRANRSFLNLLELTHSEVQGRNLGEVFRSRFGVGLDEFLKAGAEEKDAAGNGGLPEMAFGERWFRVHLNQIQSDQVQGGGSILLLTDVTDHKKLQETLKMSERLAATGRLAHIIAHEINNPLEAMSNLLFLARDEVQDEPGRGYIEQAEHELRRISQITKQVLAYHRESKEPVPSEPSEILTSVLALFRSHMIGHGVEVEKRCSATRSIAVHPGEIRQAFGNLMSNAVEAMGKRGGRMRVRCFDSVDLQTGRQGVRFAFSDNGTGIAEEALGRMFEAFYTTKGDQGSGIGLWLTSEVMAKHQGRVRVRSRTAGRHRGTLLDVFLPARQ